MLHRRRREIRIGKLRHRLGPLDQPLSVCRVQPEDLHLHFTRRLLRDLCDQTIYKLKLRRLGTHDHLVEFRDRLDRRLRSLVPEHKRNNPTQPRRELLRRLVRHLIGLGLCRQPHGLLRFTKQTHILVDVGTCTDERHRSRGLIERTLQLRRIIVRRCIEIVRVGKDRSRIGSVDPHHAHLA